MLDDHHNWIHEQGFLPGDQFEEFAHGFTTSTDYEIGPYVPAPAPTPAPDLHQRAVGAYEDWAVERRALDRDAQRWERRVHYATLVARGLVGGYLGAAVAAGFYEDYKEQQAYPATPAGRQAYLERLSKAEVIASGESSKKAVQLESGAH